MPSFRSVLRTTPRRRPSGSVIPAVASPCRSSRSPEPFVVAVGGHGRAPWAPWRPALSHWVVLERGFAEAPEEDARIDDQREAVGRRGDTRAHFAERAGQAAGDGVLAGEVDRARLSGLLAFAREATGEPEAVPAVDDHGAGAVQLAGAGRVQVLQRHVDPAGEVFVGVLLDGQDLDELGAGVEQLAQARVEDRLSHRCSAARLGSTARAARATGRAPRSDTGGTSGRSRCAPRHRDRRRGR